MTPLKILKQVLAYITRHSEFYTPYSVSLIGCYCLLWPCINMYFYSVLISLLDRKISVCGSDFDIWITLDVECNIVSVQSVTIYFNAFIFSTWCSVITFFKPLLTFIYMLFIWNEICSFLSDFSPFWMWEVTSLGECPYKINWWRFLEGAKANLGFLYDWWCLRRC